MPLTREQKSDQVAWMQGVLNDNEVVVVMRNHGMTVAEVSDLRARMREAGGGVKVVKNRLAKIALKDAPGGEVADLFTGPTVIAYSEDPVTAPKVIVKYAKENEKLEILGGRMGDQAMDAKGIDTLSEMPSREEIIASIVGQLMAPASNLINAVTAPASNIASILKTLEERENA
ncbi:50S ribosomal protein L10 [Parvularcula dongshanensis]|uniref:Large ribosomal subunit protein uL10 n=1 Tax=Parvularcula dongshanensis TaxID=1173995 RepID=A0A840I3U3_9PROT|nr:50S ribosomal protein L10 [Parvularcula dongshanensis]MBB4658933.1 large subunit ribosomal protein L10 [Parvularcula dongshanensis]